ncbi:MAG: hypothetical protein KJ927_04860, partial [Candidatus Eisenbacteria bacterium]|nr:hypothetical protein [Candidatus Eisenbacteria bacterium]
MRRALPLIIALVVVIGMGLTGIGSPEGSEPTTVGGNDPVQSAKNVVTMDRQEIPSSKPENPPSNQELTLREQLEQLPGWQPYVYESLGRRDPF